MRVRRALLFLAIAAAQFALFETGLRIWGHSEAAPSFQARSTIQPLSRSLSCPDTSACVRGLDSLWRATTRPFCTTSK